MISELAIVHPGYSYLQASIQEILDMPAGLFFQLLEDMRAIRAKQSPGQG